MLAASRGSAGSRYQVGQQARHELRLTPQFGGTVEAFARHVKAVGGGIPASLTGGHRISRTVC